MEEWRDIKGYEGLYQVSNLGNVMSLNYNHTGKPNLLKPGKDTNGYPMVILVKDGKRKMFSVHRLVAETFLENPNNYPVINHKDEDKTNNRVENLEWCTISYNNSYGTHNERVSKAMTNGKLSKIVLQFSLSGEFIREWPSTMECKRNGFCSSCVIKCCNGKQKQHKGFLWRYKE